MNEGRVSGVNILVQELVGGIGEGAYFWDQRLLIYIPRLIMLMLLSPLDQLTVSSY